MKRLLPSRYGSLLAAVLLSACTAAWAAEPQPKLAHILLLEAQHLNREESWPAATTAARVAMEAGRREGVNGIVAMLDGGSLLVNLLYKQGKYAEARAAAEEQVEYEEQQTASFGSTVTPDLHGAALLGLAIEASMAAGDRAAVVRLQEKLYSVAKPYSGLWRLSPDEPRLHYELAGLSLPLILGQWKLTKFEPANSRDFDSRVLYTQKSADSHLSAEISLSYDELQRKKTSSQRQEWLKSYDELGEQKARASAMPDLPFDGLTAVKLQRPEPCDGEPCTNVYWTALRGDWRMEIDVIFRSRDEAQAVEQVRKLFAALKWQSAPQLFRERTMAEQNRDMDSHWNTPGGWSKAAELAEQAKPDAFFSEEIARLQTFIGVAQYRRGALDAARRTLDLAVLAWGDGSAKNEKFYKAALDYAADIAYRQRRDTEAVALNRTFIEWQESDASMGWGIPKGENAFVNHWAGMRLPLRVGTYRLRLGDANHFYYENLQTGAQLGLTVGLAQSSDQELESLLRAFMTKKLGLQAGEMHITKFSPKPAEHGEPQATGRKWEFDVTKLPDGKGASEEAPATGVLRETPIKMAFWIVDRKGQRSLLRAPIMDGGQTKAEANLIAQALSL
ncbi:hypothetical protein FQ192_12085 [Pseudomonas sp. ANT_J12]|uniref:hypothetical protein n=1 Tax=Pseudomonas sp. ANT_J12 TaxID=2597351 RepID=UPI0011F22AC3|nr:hypothetical protein [Pseudomonas sp. ANT_J12]KAA0994851.1 hypothetical protein FQ192_12085 [Pseudomonas sp. ANT_J12]